jgi:hypothetical protein
LDWLKVCPPSRTGRFKNDIERLETLFQLYTEMTSVKAPLPQPLSPKRGEGSKKGGKK